MIISMGIFIRKENGIYGIKIWDMISLWSLGHVVKGPKHDFWILKFNVTLTTISKVFRPFHVKRTISRINGVVNRSQAWHMLCYCFVLHRRLSKRESIALVGQKKTKWCMWWLWLCEHYFSFHLSSMYIF